MSQRLRMIRGSRQNKQSKSHDPRKSWAGPRLRRPHGGYGAAYGLVCRVFIRVGRGTFYLRYLLALRELPPARGADDRLDRYGDRGGRCCGELCRAGAVGRSPAVASNSARIARSSGACGRRKAERRPGRRPSRRAAGTRSHRGLPGIATVFPERPGATPEHNAVCRPRSAVGRKIRGKEAFL
jgi:hypothetical protein